MTKKGLKIFLILMLLLVILFVFIYVFLSIKAKPILISQLEKSLNRKVDIDRVILIPLLNLEIKNLGIEGILEAESVFVSPNIFGILSGKLTLSKLKISKPKFDFKREKEREEKILFLDRKEAEKVSLTFPARKIFLQKVIIEKGYVNFSDTVIRPEGINLIVKELNLKIENLEVPFEGEVSRFSLKGLIPWRDEEQKGRIEATGWIDLYRKDMQADLMIEGIDGVYMSPYYSEYLSPENLGIEKATLNLSSQIQSHKNDLIANCQLELTDLSFKERLPEDKEKVIPKEMITKILDIFKTLEKKICLSFVIKTKMDSPQFRIEDVKMAVEERISESQKDKFKPEDVIGLPTKILERIIRGATDISKATIEGVRAIGSGIKRMLEEAFRREKRE